MKTKTHWAMAKT